VMSAEYENRFALLDQRGIHPSDAPTCSTQGQEPGGLQPLGF
jgi:hypothetical protein